jgi:glutathione synthase/RimK-type ligase-like ATP-grasp enzyme
MTVKMRGGRKRVVVPDGAPAWSQPSTRVDSTLVKAIARAHRWKNMLESGSYASVAELAAAERINASYVARVLRLSLLAPDLVETLLASKGGSVTVIALMGCVPLEWAEQRRLSAL